MNFETICTFPCRWLQVATYPAIQPRNIRHRQPIHTTTMMPYATNTCHLAPAQEDHEHMQMDTWRNGRALERSGYRVWSSRHLYWTPDKGSEISSSPYGSRFRASQAHLTMSLHQVLVSSRRWPLDPVCEQARPHIPSPLITVQPGF